VHPLARFDRASFKLPTEAHPSSIKNRGSSACIGPTALASRPPAVADVRDRDHSLSRSSGYKNPCRCKVSPLRHFFLPAEVSSAISSPSASRRATGPFFISSGGFTPLTRVLLLPQFAPSSGKDFGLHRTSRRRPPSMALVLPTIDEAWPNVCGALVQPKSQRGSFFTDLTLGSTFDAVDHCQSDRLASETPSPTTFP
jgi:hypothetical protein